MTIFLIVLTIFKLWLARFLPLLGDEAYYALWARHLDLSFVDHPPMIAWINWAINLFAGYNDFGIRLTAVLLVLLSTYLIYLIGKEAFSHKIGLASALLFNLIPTYLAGGLFLTPEQPLIIFWLLSTYACVKLFKHEDKRYWYLLGLTIGLGLLSKYPMILFLPGVLLFLLLSKNNRLWFRRQEPYLAALLAVLIFSPVLIWNYQHGFPALTFHGARLSSPHYIDNVLTFFVLQFLMYSPPLFLFSISVFLCFFWKERQQYDEMSLLLVSLSFPAFLVFLLVSPYTQIGGHWTSMVYLGMLIVFCAKLFALTPTPWKTTRFWINLGLIILLNILAVGYYAFFYPLPADLKGKAYTLNQELPKYIRDAKVNYVFSNQMGVASLVAYYGKTEVYMPKGLWRQFDLWDQPELKKGDSILYFAFDESDTEKRLKPLFGSVKLDPQKRLFAKDSDIPLKTKVYVCRQSIQSGNNYNHLGAETLRRRLPE